MSHYFKGKCILCLASQGAAEAVLAGSAAGSLSCLLIFLTPPPSLLPPHPFFHLKALQTLVFLFLAKVPRIPRCWGCASWEMRVPGDLRAAGNRADLANLAQAFPKQPTKNAFEKKVKIYLRALC